MQVPGQQQWQELGAVAGVEGRQVQLPRCLAAQLRVCKQDGSGMGWGGGKVRLGDAESADGGYNSADGTL